MAKRKRRRKRAPLSDVGKIPNELLYAHRELEVLRSSGAGRTGKRHLRKTRLLDEARDLLT